MAKPVVEKKYTLGERVYLLEILKGMGLTWKHFMFNVKASFRPGPHTVPTTWQYPEDRREISPVFRGGHMMALDDQGREKCVGCGMCAKTCPAKCITVKRGKVAEGEESRYAGKTYCAEFEIDLLRCIFCGFCAEACNKDALMLGQDYELASYTPEGCQRTKEIMIESYRRHKAAGTLRPPAKPVPVAEPPAAEVKAKPAAAGKAPGAAAAKKPVAAKTPKAKAKKAEAAEAAAEGGE
jgi:NADH-quinone oxidoreductase subunit I